MKHAQTVEKILSIITKDALADASKLIEFLENENFQDALDYEARCELNSLISTTSFTVKLANESIRPFVLLLKEERRRH